MSYSNNRQPTNGGQNRYIQLDLRGRVVKTYMILSEMSPVIILILDKRGHRMILPIRCTICHGDHCWYECPKQPSPNNNRRNNTVEASASKSSPDKDKRKIVLNAIQVLPTVALSTSSISKADELSLMDEFLDSLCSFDESVIDDTKLNGVSDNDVSLKQRYLVASKDDYSFFDSLLKDDDIVQVEDTDDVFEDFWDSLLDDDWKLALKSSSLEPSSPVFPCEHKEWFVFLDKYISIMDPLRLQDFESRVSNSLDVSEKKSQFGQSLMKQDLAKKFFNDAMTWDLTLRAKSLEWWCYEVLLLLSGLLPNPELQTSTVSICLNFTNLAFQIPFGLAATISTRVSTELGAGRPQAAYRAMLVGGIITETQACIMSILILSFHKVLGSVFSEDSEVIEAVAVLLKLAAISTIFDSTQAVLSGIARGCGWQTRGAFINLGAFYIVGLPIGACLGFLLHCKQGVYG
ncbi:hypothetical protein L7F22_000436 [Adiantum nelumboides]|nr:hypothetical protein [Adiantum nelumboides]